MQLPCKHIFAVHKMNDLTLFEPSFCAECRTLQYYKSSQYILYDQHDQDTCDDGNFFMQVWLQKQGV